MGGIGMSRPLRLEFAGALDHDRNPRAELDTRHTTAQSGLHPALQPTRPEDGPRAPSSLQGDRGRRSLLPIRCAVLRRVGNEPIVKVARRAGISAPRVAQIQAEAESARRKGRCRSCWINIG
jgi:hypothetical protein